MTTTNDPCKRNKQNETKSTYHNHRHDSLNQLKSTKIRIDGSETQNHSMSRFCLLLKGAVTMQGISCHGTDIKLSMNKTCLDIPVQHVQYFLYSLTHPKVLLQGQHFHAVMEKKERYQSILQTLKLNTIVAVTVCNRTHNYKPVGSRCHVLRA